MKEKITIDDIDKRLNGIEEVLKMLVVNSLVDDIDKERMQLDRKMLYNNKKMQLNLQWLERKR